MFRKNTTPKPDAMGSRLKAIAETKAPDAYEDGPSRVRSERDAVFKPATVLLLHGERVPVVIKDISETGARVQFFASRPLRERLLLSESSLALNRWADVVWEEDGAVGLRFAERLKR
jgi:hypothetical protein